MIAPHAEAQEFILLIHNQHSPTMENPGNKIRAQFVALHIGQQVEYEVIFGDSPQIRTGRIDGVQSYGIIVDYDDNMNFEEVDFDENQPSVSLRSVSDLTDEEILKVAKICGLISPVIDGSTSKFVEVKEYRKFAWRLIIRFEGTITCDLQSGLLAAYDYLRSIGILLPFTFITPSGEPRTLSTEEIIELGWVKIEKR